LFARMDWRVHYGVVEVLALDRGVIAKHDVAVMKAATAVDCKPVTHRHADGGGYERRHAASALCDQLSGGIGQPDRKVVVLVDVRAERRALDVGVDLVRDRDETMPDHFERDRINGERRAANVLHAALPLFFSAWRHVKRAPGRQS